MKILLMNDTSHVHAGCVKVIDFYKEQFKDHDLDILPRKEKIEDTSMYDLIVVNGEGTMHDDAPKAYEMLEVLSNAKCKTMMVNSVWQNNSPELTEMLMNVDYVSVREIRSKREILSVIDRQVDVYLDFGFFHDVPKSSTKIKYERVTGNRMGSIRDKPKVHSVGETHTVDIFTQSWEELVQELRKTRVFITGRHHELYAACKAGCNFVILEGNTHKNSGLFETFGLDIPCLPMDATTEQIQEAIDNIDMYQLYQQELLFYYMRQQKAPRLLDYA